MILPNWETSTVDNSKLQRVSHLELKVLTIASS